MYLNLKIYEIFVALFMTLKYSKNQIKSLILKSLEKNFQNNYNTFFLSSGRSGLTFALKNEKFDNKSTKKKVLVPSFTCEIVPIELMKMKAIIEYYDGPPNYLDDLKLKLKNSSSDIFAVVVQHSFGVHLDISEISEMCKEKKIILIEDKALCFLSKKKNIDELQGDYAYYSFESSKLITCMMGGMVITKKKNSYIFNSNIFNSIIVNLRVFISALLYKIPGDIGFAIRKLFILLRLIRASINKSDINIANKNNTLRDLTSFQLCLILIQLNQIDKIKKKYKQNLILWQNLLEKGSLDIFSQNKTFLTTRFAYTGDRADLVKRALIEIGLYQDDWFTNGIGDEKFNHNNINFNLKKFPNTVDYLRKYTNLPTQIILNKKNIQIIKKFINN